MSDESESRLHVVAAVIRRADGCVLVSRRPAHVEQGDLWEFPGGKVQRGETRLQALSRELHEELGIRLARATPLLRVPHDYPARHVLLDVFVVDAWDDEPRGCEGQLVRWVAAGDLVRLSFPAANLPIVTAARLPRLCVVTPTPAGTQADFIADLDACLARGARLVQLRAPGLTTAAYRALAIAALACCRGHGARLMLNADPATCLDLGADGAHLTAARLRAADTRPVPRDILLSASCHDAVELAHARHIGVDVAFVSPVLATASHPDAAPLGWSALERLVAMSALPVYALGGMGPGHVREALGAGCVGVAGIGALWSGSDALDDAALLARAGSFAGL